MFVGDFFSSSPSSTSNLSHDADLDLSLQYEPMTSPQPLPTVNESIKNSKT